MHGPHQVVYIEERVKFGHFLGGDDLGGDAYNTATEHRGTMTFTALWQRSADSKVRTGF